MPDFDVPGAALPFLSDRDGKLAIHVPGIIKGPVGEADDNFASATFHPSGSLPLAIRGGSGWNLGLDLRASAALSLVRPTSHEALQELGLDSYFADHPDDVAMVCRVGAAADGSFAGRFQDGALSVRSSLKAGADVSFRYVRPCARTAPLDTTLVEFLQHVRLPGTVQDELVQGELIEFGYGGSLKFGAALSAGYDLSGTGSPDIGSLHLSESYRVAASGTLTVGAALGGLFSVQVRRDDRSSAAHPWVRVVVKKNRSRQFSFAADVMVEATSALTGLSESPNAFLAAVLGLNARGWVDTLGRLGQFTDWTSLGAGVDELTKAFLGTVLDQGFEALRAAPLPQVLARVAKIVDAYNATDTTVLAVFERYYDKVTSSELGPEVSAALETIAGFKSWDALNGSVPAVVWTLVNQLTDGDPLGWVVDKSIAELQERAASVLTLGRATVEKQIPALIGLVKHELGLDPLIRALDKVDSPDKLKAEASTRLGAFVDRLIGERIAAIGHDPEIAALFRRVHDVLGHIADVEGALYAKFTEVLNSSYSFTLHQAYTRTDTDAALVDISFDLSDPDTRTLYLHAVSGNFEDALGAHQRPTIRVNHGVLTHTAPRALSLDVNVIGWRDGWHYHGVEKLVAQSAQQMVGSDQGAVTVFTQVDVTDDAERKWQGQRLATHFLLRLAGESTGLLHTDPATHGYLVNTVSKLQASYSLDFDREVAREADIQFYLSFAKEFGIGAAAGFDAATIVGLLRSATGAPATNVTATYDVRYDGNAVHDLFAQPTPETFVRSAMRRGVLASYVSTGGNIAAMGWAYGTPGIYLGWIDGGRQNQAVFTAPGPLQFPVAKSPFDGVAAPATVTLSREQRITLDALYRIEDAVVRTLEAIHQDIASPTPVSSLQLERALTGFDEALRLVRQFTEGINGMFALFDALVTRTSPRSRKSSLTLKAVVDGRETSKVFVSL